MKKINLNVCYEYHGDKIGSIPLISVKYLTNDEREIDAGNVLVEKRDAYKIQHTHMFSGKVVDGEDFSVENYKDIPIDAVSPIREKPYEYYDIPDYTDTDLESKIKKAISETSNDHIRYCYCLDHNSNYEFNSTKDISDKKFNNAVLSEIKLDHDVLTNLNLSIEDKVEVIADKFVEIYKTIKNNPNYNIDNFDFEIEGMKLDLLNGTENMKEIVKVILINGSKKSFKRCTELLNEKFKDKEQTKKETQKPNLGVNLYKGDYFSYGVKYYVEFEYANKEEQEKMFNVFDKQLLPSYGSHSYRNSRGFEGDYIMPFLINENGNFTINGRIVGGTNIPDDLLPGFIKRFVELDGAVVKIGDEEIKDFFDEEQFNQLLSKLENKKRK